MEGYAVDPKADCPHLNEVFHPFTSGQLKVVGSECKGCQDKSENWMCLHCHNIYCSRYIKGHFKKHFEEKESHCIGVSFSDLSVWCFQCDSYLKSPKLHPTLKYLAELKFNEVPEEDGNGKGEVEVGGKRQKCKTDNCENFGNEENDGICNKCKYGFLPFGPNYEKWFKDMPKFPEPKVFREAEVPISPNTTEMGKRTGALSTEDLTEFMDDPEVIEAKAKLMAQLIKESKYLVSYTGAGISTSCKIPDYRGPKGVWTLGAIGKKVEKSTPLTLALPSPCHYSLVKLHKDGIMKCTVSTNVDGLHRRSGIPTDELCELHGNIYLEKCENCKEEYFRKFNVMGHKSGHRTGRKCEKKGCKGNLMDSIIHFGENLPEKEISSAVDHSKNCDLALVLGTSMRVRPACNLPEMIWADKNKPPGKLVIVNLQKTPYDKHCYLRVYSKTDEFMELVMKELYKEEQFDLREYTSQLNEKIEKMGEDDKDINSF